MRYMSVVVLALLTASLMAALHAAGIGLPMPHSQARLSVVIPLGWLRDKGFVAGFAEAIATTPNGHHVISATFLDLSRPNARAFIRLPTAELLGQGWPQGGLAAVHVNLYLYDTRGHLCLKAATIDTLTYLEHRMPPEKAAEEALRHPGAVLEAGEIEFKPQTFTPCIDLTEALKTIVEKQLERTEAHGKPQLAPAEQYMLPGTRLLLINDLTKIRNPPASWKAHIQPQYYAKDAWDVFTYHYSFAVLVPKYYSLSAALYDASLWYRLATNTKTAPSGKAAYGLTTMDNFVKALFYFEEPVSWSNMLRPGTVLKHFDEAPIVILNTSCRNCYSSHSDVIAWFANSRYVSTKYGISILGVIVWPHATNVLKISGGAVRGLLDADHDLEALVAPMDDVYEADGMLVLLYVGNYSDSRGDYWMIVPVVSPVVLHYYRFNYAEAHPVRLRPGHTDYYGVLNALQYMTTQYDVVSGSVITPLEREVNKQCVYEGSDSYTVLDDFQVSDEWSNSFAAFIAYTGNKALWLLAASLLPDQLGVFISVASYLVSVTYMDVHAASQGFKLYFAPGGGNDMLSLTVVKLTQRYMTSIDAVGGVYPTLVVYRVAGEKCGGYSCCG